MFKIVSEPLIWWPVTFPGVGEDGDVVENRFEMRFRVMGEDAHLDFLTRVNARGAVVVGEDAVTAPSAAASEVVLEIARDWRGVGAENGEPLKFDAAHLRQLLDVPNVFTAVLRAYAACRAGRAEARAGN
ncbi:MAG: histidine kinase [Sphingobium sp.]